MFENDVLYLKILLHLPGANEVSAFAEDMVPSVPRIVVNT